MAKKRAKKKTVRPDDLTIVKAAKLLSRSYSWVYSRLKELGRDNTIRHKGVIFIRSRGFDKLAALSARAPKRGRPRVVPSF